MKRKICYILLLCCLLLASCSPSETSNSDSNTVDVEKEEKNGNSGSQNVVGGIDTVEDTEIVSLGGVLEGADPEDIAELEDSIDLEEVENMSEEEQQELVGGLSVIADRHNQIVTEVSEELESSDVDVEMDETTGKITMDESILFGKDEDSLSEEGKDYLDSFIQSYAEAILNQGGEEYVAEIRIIGHTDTSGEYDYNLDLSERRAETVKNYCLESEKNGLDEEKKEKLKKLLTTKGKSYDEPILDENGNVDMKASRRVEFKIIMNIDND